MKRTRTPLVLIVVMALASLATGKATSPRMGESTIMDGEVDGDSLSFWITVKFGGNELK